MQDLEVSTKHSIYFINFLGFYSVVKVNIFSCDLQKKLMEAKALNNTMTEEKNKYSQLFEEEKETSLQNLAKVGSS